LSWYNRGTDAVQVQPQTQFEYPVDRIPTPSGLMLVPSVCLGFFVD